MALCLAVSSLFINIVFEYVNSLFWLRLVLRIFWCFMSLFDYVCLICVSIARLGRSYLIVNRGSEYREFTWFSLFEVIFFKNFTTAWKYISIPTDSFSNHLVLVWVSRNNRVRVLHWVECFSLPLILSIFFHNWIYFQRTSFKSCLLKNSFQCFYWVICWQNIIICNPISFPCFCFLNLLKTLKLIILLLPINNFNILIFTRSFI